MVSKAMPLIIDWYEHHARDLPWRGDGVSPWGVLVSEVMLQQTPVNRVLPIYQLWMSRWPAPSDLAGSSPGDAVRAWGRLGYPRRALRLHSAAVVCAQEHDGQVPSSIGQLRALPGIGEYTAAAVASFAFQQRHAVLDTNVRRVHARLLDGRQFEESGSTTVAERRRALALLPQDPAQAARVSIAVMELGRSSAKLGRRSVTHARPSGAARGTSSVVPTGTEQAPWPDLCGHRPAMSRAFAGNRAKRRRTQ